MLKVQLDAYLSVECKVTGVYFLFNWAVFPELLQDTLGWIPKYELLQIVAAGVQDLYGVSQKNPPPP